MLREGETCWRVVPARRAAVLIDSDRYFRAVRSAILQARHCIFIVGWDIDSRTCLLPPGEEADGAPVRLGELLRFAKRRRPALEIHLLLWDFTVAYALEREMLPMVTFGWGTPRIKICLDDALPLGASHHQKLVVIDDALAFCGGMDLGVRRWDTCEHRPDDPRRRDPNDAPYQPVHDVQMCVNGPAAAALAAVARARWSCATSQAALAPLPDPPADLWPQGVAPDFENTEVAIARTLPDMPNQQPAYEVEALFLESIAQAERYIYVENQYLTARGIAEALIRRLRVKPDLEVLVVGPKQPHGWLEARTMGAGRIRFANYLVAAGVAGQVRLVYPAVSEGPEECAIMVHAKLMIVDDRLLRIGSANLNNRSMGVDSECDLAVLARNESEAQAIASVRDRLVGEHLGVAPEAVRQAERKEGSLLRAIAALQGPARGLRPLPLNGEYDDEISVAMLPMADPERPLSASDLFGEIYGPRTVNYGRRHMIVGLFIALLLVGLLLLWQVTPLSEYARPEALEANFIAIRESIWTPLWVVLVYVIGGLVVFPIMVLIAVTAMVFEPLAALSYALLGSLLSASCGFAVGASLGRKPLRAVLGRRLTKVSRAFARRGVIAVTAMRLVPIAPFTLINLVAGASHVRFRDYLAGTVLGMSPGILLMTAFGETLMRLWQDPNVANTAMLGATILAWIGLSIGLHKLLTRLQRRRHA